MSDLFELALPFEATEPDVLDLWRVSAIPATSASFEADGLARECTVVWRLDLPGDLLAASALLASQEAALDLANNAVLDAGQRLQVFVQDKAKARDVASFALSADTLREPERALASWALEFRGEASFFPGHDIVAEARELADQARRFIAQVRQTLAYAARVETVQDGVRVALTEITWLGDARSTGCLDLGLAQAELHGRSLATVVATKGAWLRLITQLTQNAILLGAAVFSGNAVLGLAAAWRFVKTILNEWRRRQAAVPI